jgi:hypothetical protein
MIWRDKTQATALGDNKARGAILPAQRILLAMFHPRQLVRRRSVWVIACIAVLLNAAAPVMAYFDDEALIAPGGTLLRSLAQAPSHAQDTSGHSHGDTALSGHEHGHHESHCPYCLDFAAGAALGTAPSEFSPPAAVAERSTPVATRNVEGRASVRIALARAPPPHS